MAELALFMILRLRLSTGRRPIILCSLTIQAQRLTAVV